MEVTLVKDIMTTDIITVTPATSIMEVTKIFAEKHLNGLPVVDADKKLVGLITEYNLITAESILNLPALEKISKDSQSPLHELEYLSAQVKKTASLTVGDIMEKAPMTLSYDDTFEIALETLIKHHRVNPLPVVDKDKKLVGVVSRYDLLKLLKLFGHN
jgi:CBS domain-containing protein